MSSSSAALPATEQESAAPVLKFAVVAVVVHLHLLRNISLPLYLMLYLLTAGWLVARYAFLPRDRRPRASLLTAWIGVALFGCAVTIVVSGVAPAVSGLGRFLFAVPIYLALAVYVKSVTTLVKCIRVLTAIFAVGALTVPLQLAIGPVSWWADASERAGLERYSSILGSLTAIGVVGGSYLVLMHMNGSAARLPAMLGALLGIGASLSKAAIANVGLGLLAIAWIMRRRASRLFMSVLGLLLIFAMLLMFDPVQERVAASLQSFGLGAVSTAPTNFDDTLIESAEARLTTLPVANLSALATLDTIFVYFTGAGYGMASTALVPKEYELAPMAHNQYVEFLTVFGPLGGLALVAVMLSIFTRLRRLPTHDYPLLPGLLSTAFALLCVNALFANGVTYQPASASMFFMLMFCASVDTSSSSFTNRGDR